MRSGEANEPPKNTGCGAALVPGMGTMLPSLPLGRVCVCMTKKALVCVALCGRVEP